MGDVGVVSVGGGVGDVGVVGAVGGEEGGVVGEAGTVAIESSFGFNGLLRGAVGSDLASHAPLSIASAANEMRAIFCTVLSALHDIQRGLRVAPVQQNDASELFTQEYSIKKALSACIKG